MTFIFCFFLPMKFHIDISKTYMSTNLFEPMYKGISRSQTWILKDSSGNNRFEKKCIAVRTDSR